LVPKLSSVPLPESDDSGDNFLAELKLKKSAELERELAQYCFDLLFIQTQLEASRTDHADFQWMKESAGRRLPRLQRKIEAVKQELFSRNENARSSIERVGEGRVHSVQEFY
jgi:hypothetical protein